MTYRPAIGESMRALGLRPSEPTYTCDEDGCDARHVVQPTRYSTPPQWFTKQDAKPPGWSRSLDADGRPLHFCREHRT